MWQLLRPLHWTKNLFVLAPIPFALSAQVGVSSPWGVAVVGFASFCALASAVYAFNDVWDCRFDRQHPTKRLRPVAAGRVSRRRALLWSLGLAVGGLALCSATGTARAVTLGVTYLLLQVFYTVVGKKLPLVDVFLLMFGYLLRVAFGCALVGVAPSGWLLLCTAGLTLFLGLCKRRADLRFGAAHRPVLASYDARFLDQAIAIAAAATLLSYALYAMNAQVFVPGREFWGVPFVAFGILEYLRLVQAGQGGAPVETLLRTPTLWISILGWMGATYLGLQIS